jgi:CRISPR-associated endonuclease/helicase Cas3
MGNSAESLGVDERKTCIYFLNMQGEDQLWGKIGQDAEGTTFLPLECHLADVATVFEALCRSHSVRSRLSKALGRELTEADIARLSILALLHDLGKITPGFQNKAAVAKPQHGHVCPIPGLFCESNLAHLFDCLPWLPGWGADGGACVFRLLVAAFSHHGTPIPLEENIGSASLWPTRKDAAGWRFLKELGKQIPLWFPEAFAPEAPSLPVAPILEHLFAGLVMLADWLGSDTRFFPIAREKRDLTTIDFSRRQAATAVRSVGLDTAAWRAAVTVPPRFERQFEFQPNELQRAVDCIPLQPEGGLAIIEAETGVGKTEAALRYFTRLWASGLVDGLYFANPLRFAATQLFGRISHFAGRTFGNDPPPVVLAVPGYLQVDDVSGVRLPDFTVRWDDEPAAAEAERRWACEHPKRYLAAPLAVGTIDQALLAGLRTPHAHLRAAALSRSLLVIDEVHASDPYMTELTLGVLDLFHRVGGQALLLSATLGGEARAKYLRTMGGTRGAPDMEAWLRAPYPCISTPSGGVAVEDNQQEGVRKPPIRCQLLGIQNDPGAVAKLSAEEASRSGRILILRNSVASGVETLEAVELLVAKSALFQVSGVVCPHHSRYARVDREMLDGQVESWFGKQGACGSGVLVSSQTLEQSLDVDFDLLITDLCPMDVLLQRLGRLHRHRSRDAERPPGRKEPICILLTPEAMSAEALRSKRARRHQYGKDRAYANLPALMATWELLLDLEQRGEPLRIPEMSRSLVERALHSEALESVAHRHGLDAEFTAALGVAGARATQGRYAVIRWDQPFSEQCWKREDPNPLTRLGSADMVVDFEEPFLSPFDNAVDRLVLPEFLLPKAALDAPPQVISSGPRGTVFRLGETDYIYSRFGLHKEKPQ